MTDKAISPLRRQLIEDMAIRRLSPGLSTNIFATSKSLPISSAGLPTRPPPRMSIAISCGWPRSGRRWEPPTSAPLKRRGTPSRPFSPMPTGRTTLHWPAGSSVYPTRRRPARTATAPKIFTKAASGTLVLAAADVWSSSRPSNPAASLGCGLSHRSGSTAHDHHTAVAIPRHRFRPTPPFHWQRPPFADSDRQLRLRPAKPGASSTRSLRRSHPRWPKPAPRRSLNRRPIRNRQIRSSSAGKFPIDRHQRRRELPRGFLLRGFSDACLRAAPPPGDWQASENP